MASKAGSGIGQRRLGDDFENLVVERVREQANKSVGLPKDYTLEYAHRTKGSRGEADIIAVFTMPGSVKVALIQAKRNAYLPPDDRRKLARLLKSGGDAMMLYMAYYLNDNDWTVLRLKTEEDFTRPTRIRKWDDDMLASELPDKEESRQERKHADFEMAIVTALKEDFDETVLPLNPQYKGHEVYFAIRTDEAPGEPAIIAMLKEKAPKDEKMRQDTVFLIFPTREAYFPPDSMQRMEGIVERCLGTGGKAIPFVAYYAHGKAWRLQRINNRADLKKFEYM